MTRVLAGALPVRHPKGELIMWREHLAVNQSLRLCRFDSCLAHRSRRPRRRRTSLAADSAAGRPKPGCPSSTLGGETARITRSHARVAREPPAKRYMFGSIPTAASAGVPLWPVHGPVHTHKGSRNTDVTSDSSGTRGRARASPTTWLR